jgi:glycyl-tRNA synthetase
MDEVGTPFCLTVDGQSAGDQSVTVRHRDSMAQDRVGVAHVAAFLAERLR